MKILAPAILLCFLSAPAFPQDPEFSQYYASPLYLNPAFCGSGAGQRVIANTRDQWPNIPGGLVTYAFSYDGHLDPLHSGVGLLCTVDKAGTAGLTSTQINVQYAYTLDFQNHWVLATGLNFGVGNRSIDFNKLVFGDQLAFDATGTSPTDDPALGQINRTSYFDFGTGVLAYNKNVWLGVSVGHLNEPNRSLVGEQAYIPMKISAHGGLKLPLYRGPMRKERVAALAPSFAYKRQGAFDQLDVGTYLLYEPLVAGIWYRGIPIAQSVGDHVNQDAVVVILGFQFDRFQIAYSYDVTVSSLGPISGGAHEVALKYEFEQQIRTHKRKKVEKRLPCPAFLK